MFSLYYPDDWSLLEAMDSGSHCPEDEQSPGVGLAGERCMCSGGCGDVKAVEEDLRAGGAAWRSSLNHYCTRVCHVPNLIFSPVCLLTRSLIDFNGRNLDTTKLGAKDS